MGRVLIGSIFRLHYFVTNLPTEGDGIRELVRAIAPDRCKQEQEDRGDREVREESPMPRVIQINLRKAWDALVPCPASTASLYPHPDGNGE